MIELAIRIKCAEGSDKIHIDLNPNHFDATAVEKDVCRGLYPLVSDLLSQILGQEGFNRSQNVESKLVDKSGTPLSDDYMVTNGMVEPESGPQIIDAKTGQ